MRARLGFYKTKDYFSISTIRNILEDFQKREIFEIKYVSIFIKGQMIKTYLYKDFDWSDKVLTEKIITSGMFIFGETSSEWEKKYLHKLKSYDLDDFNGNYGLINGGLRPRLNSREGSIGWQSTDLWFQFGYTEDVSNKMIEYAKYFSSQYDMRYTQLRIKDTEKDKLGITYDGIINASSVLFRGVEYCLILCHELVQEIGIEKILKAPAYKIDVLENGSVFIQSSQSLLDYINPEIKDKKFDELRKLNDYLFSINVPDEIHDSIRKIWHENLEAKHITIDDLLDI